MYNFVHSAQAATILVSMASGKNIWRLNFWRKSPNGGITGLSLYPSHHSESKINLIDLKGFCAPLAMLPGLSSF